MVKYRTTWARYVELWFDEPEPPERFDVLVRHRALQPGPAGATSEFHSLQIDLARDRDEVLRSFARNTRAQIRKSIDEDGLRIEFFDRPTSALFEEFRIFYDAFATSKGLTPLATNRLRAYFESDCFSLSRVSTPDRTLVWHANVSYGRYITMMHSASLFRSGDDDFRKLVGRANRRLHWEEFGHFQDRGYEVFDFGGWYVGSTDPQKISINRFKGEFGGTQVLEFTVKENRSLVAKANATLQVARLFGPRSNRKDDIGPLQRMRRPDAWSVIPS